MMFASNLSILMRHRPPPPVSLARVNRQSSAAASPRSKEQGSSSMNATKLRNVYRRFGETFGVSEETLLGLTRNRGVTLIRARFVITCNNFGMEDDLIAEAIGRSTGTVNWVRTHFEPSVEDIRDALDNWSRKSAA